MNGLTERSEVPANVYIWKRKVEDEGGSEGGGEGGGGGGEG